MNTTLWEIGAAKGGWHINQGRHAHFHPSYQFALNCLNKSDAFSFFHRTIEQLCSRRNSASEKWAHRKKGRRICKL